MRTVDEIKMEMVTAASNMTQKKDVTQRDLTMFKEGLVVLEQELRAMITAGISPNRLEAICAAEKLIGKTVFDTYSGKIKELTVTSFEAFDNNIQLKCQRGLWQELISGRLGKTVFLTCEEAEEKLEGATP